VYFTCPKYGQTKGKITNVNLLKGGI